MRIKHYVLEITLYSDMCCGTGEGNGSSIDCCTAFDDVGLPFIPAKRLKGLLREQAEFLAQYGKTTEKIVDKLFGSFNVNGADRLDGAIRVNNAVLENYEALHTQLPKYDATKDEITEAYCRLRAQTAIDDEGIARRGSLRLTQVVKKDTVFVSDVYLTNPDESVIELLKNCAMTLRQIGLNKSRGFGEVKCELHEQSESKISPESFRNTGEVKTFEYTVSLLDDVVISAGSNVTCDYIKGSMLQGAFARYVKNHEYFENVYLKRIMFSDAYINGYEPVPFSYIAVKNDDEKCYSLADGFVRKDEKQYVPVNGYYRIEGGNFYKAKVQTADEYHYSTKTHDVFTYKKIVRGQVFKGTVTAPATIVETLKKTLTITGNTIMLGGSASAQYGRCKFEFGEEKPKKHIKIDTQMIVELSTNVVVRDKYGAVSSDHRDLISAFEKLFEFDASDVDVYTKIVTGGGFNAKWKLPIQQFTAFSKGSVIVFKNCSPTGKEVPENGLFRDLTFGGYGSYKLRKLADKEYSLKEISETPKEKATDLSSEAQLAVDKMKAIIQENRSKQLVKKIAFTAANKVNTGRLSQSAAMRTYSIFLKHQGRESYETAIKLNFDGKRNKELYDFANGVTEAFNDIKNDPKIAITN